MSAQIIPTVNQQHGTCVYFGNLPVRVYAEIPSYAREDYLPIPHAEWGKWAIPDHTSVGKIVEALNLPGSYDFAIPQDFFDQYMRQHGDAPRGIWYYPPMGEKNSLFGEFRSLQSLLWDLANLAEKTWNEFCQATLPA